MGKTQSKRSVDITTESKKSPEEEVTGKLEKIEDLDQKQVNGDASPQENAETEKKDGDETENDKDLTTEKSGAESSAQDGGGDTNTGQSNASTVESASKEEDSATPKDGDKVSEEISPLADENKKPKKEKVKKKWSFRSISFGKKDKQKPAKSEDAATENAAATNGDGAAQAGEETSDKNQKDETAADSNEKKNIEKPVENGDTSEKEMNGEKTSTSTTPIEEQPAKEIASNENTINITNNTTETISSVITDTTTATENNQTEKQTNTITKLAVETTESLSAIVSNGDAIEKNGTETLSTVVEQNDHQLTDKAANLIGEASEVIEKVKSIPKVANDAVSDNNGVHQNGTSANGEELEIENESKSQVEVIFQTDQAAHTDDLVTLTATATTSSSPKTTPTLLPDPNNTDPIRIENSNICVISNSDDTQKVEEATTIVAENAASIVEDVALKEIEPVSTYISPSDTQIEGVNVDIGNENPSEPESYEIEENASQNHNEDVSRAENEITTTHDESPKPPPLPVSPPPSQVLVFAFNDNNQAIEEGDERLRSPIHTEIIAECETSHPSTSADLQNNVEKDYDSQPCIYDENLPSKENITCDLPSSTFDIGTGEPAQNTQYDADNMSTETLENSVVPQMEEKNHFNNKTAANSIDEITENELVKTATAVVNEISEKAVELIQQQNHLELQQPEIEVTNNIIITNNDSKTENTATEIDNNIKDIENKELSAHTQCNSTEEVTNVMESLNINSEDNNLIKNETPLDELESHLIDCMKTTDKHIMMDGENEIATDLCSVDITNAKDLKESAAVDVTTQDLPVICE